MQPIAESPWLLLISLCSAKVESMALCLSDKKWSMMVSCAAGTYVLRVWQLGLRKQGKIGDESLRGGWYLEVRDKPDPGSAFSEISV